MKMLLHVDIPRLGYLGDVVEVSEGYARNYLLPQRKAVQPTESNIKAIEAERAQQADVRCLAQEELQKAAEKVNGKEITLEALANEQGHLFGSVSQEDIATALRSQGSAVQSRDVILSEHVRALGDYEVKLHFSEGIESIVQLHIVRPEDSQSESEQQSETADAPVE
jgi:large subunit ribosomal protein L9